MFFTLSVTVKTVNSDVPVVQSRVLAGDLRGLHGLGGGLLGVLALILAESGQTTLAATLQDGLAVLVELQLDDQHLAGMDAHVDVGAVGVLALDLLDVDDELFAVGLDHLAHLVALEVAADHLDLIVAADGHGTHIVLLAQLLGEGSGHEAPANVGGSLEVTLAVLPARRRHERVLFHLACAGCKQKIGTALLAGSPKFTIIARTSRALFSLLDFIVYGA